MLLTTCVLFQFDRTEMILNCLNPRFSKKFVIDYYFEVVQKLKFCVYDIDNNTYDLSDDDFLGELECTLGQVSPPRRGVFRSALRSHQVLCVRASPCRSFLTKRWPDLCSWRTRGLQATGPSPWVNLCIDHPTDCRRLIGSVGLILLIFALIDLCWRNNRQQSSGLWSLCPSTGQKGIVLITLLCNAT